MNEKTRGLIQRLTLTPYSVWAALFIVVPLTYLLPYAFGMGTDGVFAAEPVSNVIGGSLCFITMLFTVLPELKRMEKEA